MRATQTLSELHDWSPNPTAATFTLPEQIAKEIGTAIIAGEIPGGTRLQEVDIATRFRVSRAPVREALRMLERDGLIAINARRGAQVTELTPKELNDLFDPRIVLNGLLARRVAESATPSFAASFRAGVLEIERIAREGDTDDYVQGVFRLHRLMSEGCDNDYLKRIVFLLAHQTARYTRLGLSTAVRRQQSIANWKRVAKAIECGDADEAQRASEQLARDSRDMAMTLLTKQLGEPRARNSSIRAPSSKVVGDK
jgi:DNA-binding GntR family transcriptional regulator